MEMEMQELADEFGLGDFSMNPPKIGTEVYSKMFDKYGDRALVGLMKEQIVNRFKYTRAQSSGGD